MATSPEDEVLGGIADMLRSVTLGGGTMSDETSEKLNAMFGQLGAMTLSDQGKVQQKQFEEVCKFFSGMRVSISQGTPPPEPSAAPRDPEPAAAPATPAKQRPPEPGTPGFAFSSPMPDPWASRDAANANNIHPNLAHAQPGAAATAKPTKNWRVGARARTQPPTPPPAPAPKPFSFGANGSGTAFPSHHPQNVAKPERPGARDPWPSGFSASAASPPAAPGPAKNFFVDAPKDPKPKARASAQPRARARRARQPAPSARPGAAAAAPATPSGADFADPLQSDGMDIGTPFGASPGSSPSQAAGAGKGRKSAENARRAPPPATAAAAAARGNVGGGSFPAGKDPWAAGGFQGSPTAQSPARPKQTPGKQRVRARRPKASPPRGGGGAAAAAGADFGFPASAAAEFGFSAAAEEVFGSAPAAGEARGPAGAPRGAAGAPAEDGSAGGEAFQRFLFDQQRILEAKERAEESRRREAAERRRREEDRLLAAVEAAAARAREAYQAKRYEEAAALYAEALRVADRHPSGPTDGSRNGRGRGPGGQQDPKTGGVGDGTGDRDSSGERILPDSAAGRFHGNRAAALMMAGRYRAAIAASDAATALDAGLLRVHCRRARAQLKAGEYHEAEARFQEVYVRLSALLGSAGPRGSALRGEERAHVEKAAEDARSGMQDSLRVKAAVGEMQGALAALNHAQCLKWCDRVLSASPLCREAMDARHACLAAKRQWLRLAHSAEAFAHQLARGAWSEGEPLVPFALGSAPHGPSLAERPSLVREMLSHGSAALPPLTLKCYTTALRMAGMPHCAEAAARHLLLLSEAEGSPSLHRFAARELEVLLNQQSLKAAGDEAFREGRYRAAVERYTGALREDPSDDAFNAKVFCNRAAARMALREERAAVEDCSAALRRDAGYGRARLRRGRAYALLGRWREAVADLEGYGSRGPEEREEVRREVEEARRRGAREQEAKAWGGYAGGAEDPGAAYPGGGSYARYQGPGAQSHSQYQYQGPGAQSQPRYQAGGAQSQPRYQGGTSSSQYQGTSSSSSSSSGSSSSSQYQGGAPRPQARARARGQAQGGPRRGYSRAYAARENASGNADSHYATLGVCESATEAQIRKAYKGLALKHHPDKSSDPGAAERFMKIKDAYEVLKRQESRRAYDLERRGFGGL